MQVINQSNGIMQLESMAFDEIQTIKANNLQMEWGRWRDVQNVYGVKRGLLHLLCSEGKIRSVLIRRRGNIHGTRYYLK